MSLFHRNNKPKSKKEDQGTPNVKPFSHKKNNVIKGPRVNPLGFFVIMLGLHPTNKAQKKKILKNADPAQIEEYKSMRMYEKGMHFPANLLTNTEMMQYYRMGTSHKQVEQIALMRFLGALAIFLLGLMIWTSSGHPKWALGFMIIGPILLWLFIGLGIRSSYKRFAIHQQFMFDILMSVLSPFLYEMNKANADSSTGAGSLSMNAILTAVSTRIRDKRTKQAVNRLNIDIEHNPISFVPYEKFAREFSTSPMVYMYMNSVYRMAHGSTDTTGIRNLNLSSMRDLLKQVDNIKNSKLKRFYVPPIFMFLDWFVIVLGYFVIYMVKMITQSMAGAKA